MNLKILINKEPEDLSHSDGGNMMKFEPFKLKEYKVFNGEKVIVTEDHIDLRLFSDCPYLMGAGDLIWFNYIKKPKPHGDYVTKAYIRWIEKAHRQVFKAEAWSTSSLFALLQMGGKISMWFFGGHHYS